MSTADRLVFEDRAHILSTSESDGGRGINASRVIHSFGGKTLAILTSGGKSGARLEALVRAHGFPVEVAPIRNEIRCNLTITDKQGLTVKLNEAGPPIDKHELDGLEKITVGQLKNAAWLMLCGSVPPGVPPGFYARLIETARKKKVRTLLDTDGEALQQGIEAKPSVVHANQQEAERLLNAALLTRAHFLDAARKLQAMGAGSVVLSLGSRGAIVRGTENRSSKRCLLVWTRSARSAPATPWPPPSTWAMVEGSAFEDAVRWGVAGRHRFSEVAGGQLR